MNPTPLVELMEASIVRPEDEVAVLQNLNWTVRAGEWWVIAGHHGSGKSAVLQTVAGLIPLGAGQMNLLGEPVLAERGRAAGWRRQVGLVFEGGGRLLRDLTVAENIALPVGYHEDCSPDVAFERIIPLIEALDLDRLADAPAGRIGRAWSQRVGLARALACQPELLLLDNPLTGLDQNHVRWWREFLPQLAAGRALKGLPPVTLVVSTENPEGWMAEGRRCVTVGGGRWELLDPSSLQSVTRVFSQEPLQPG